MRHGCFVLTVAMMACNGTDGKAPDGPPGDTSAPEVPLGYASRPANPTCLAPERPAAPGSLALTRIYPGVSFTQGVTASRAPGDDSHWYVAEKNSGRLRRFEARDDVTSAPTVLNIGSKLGLASEAGFLGFAFSPGFATDGLLYLSYTRPGLTSVLSRVRTTDGGASFDLANEEVLLTVDQPFSNHNGGHVTFGPDGHLYWGLGDGGSAGDPQNRAQNVNSLLGKLLRLDVGAPGAYQIPADNPFASGGGRPEIFAWGFRNPWRFAFDPVTGELWLGDVGQNAFEEVHKVHLGGNYGWRIKEGFACYAQTPCDGNGLIDPIIHYNHSNGVSVMGGLVYRGAVMPELVGTYLYTDFYTGALWAIVDDPVSGEPTSERLMGNSGRNLVHFSYDADGEIVVLDHSGGMYRVDPAGDVPVDNFPATLSATGCVDPSNPSDVVPGMIPYAPSHGFWSDGADKDRYFAIPDGTTLGATASGDLELPVNAVTLKHFRLAGRLVETRLFVRHSDGDWAGYSYVWRPDGSDADLAAGTTAVDVGDQTWVVPSRGACMQCHTEAAGRTLGLELRQLQGAHSFPLGRAPQLDTLVHIGLLAEPAALPPALPALDDASASVDARARAYLHTNCAMCHQPTGGGGGLVDLRADATATGLCGAPQQGSLGVDNAGLVVPGAPERSLLSLRMARRAAYAMPPVGSAVVDSQGVDLIDAWISALGACPE